ncbi:MAG TPA: NAD(P)/FAD-dependent oxidoreductase [Micromonosporaceae bacterium]|nr:NAD(P)/FAD-dependent oxidoreductase [Micromonosporaceae bacterium]
MRSAVVVGAGVGGLAAAGALARTGWRVTLLEQAERLRADRAGLLLWPNGAGALRELGLGGGLDGVTTPVLPDGIRRPDGQWLVRPDPERARAAPGVVHSEDLHDTLVAGLGDQVEVRHGIQVRTVRVSRDDRPAVGDGRSTWEADLVVAADGAHSTIRQRLAPQAAVVSGGWAGWRAVIPWYRASALPAGLATGGETIGVGYRFQYAPLGERGSAGGSTRGGVYWVATALGAPRPEPPATQLALLRRWFAGWHPPIPDLLAATEPEDLVQQAVEELRPAPPGYDFPSGPGGVVLLGDAAHTIADHLGQGACLAFEDAAILRAAGREAVPGGSLRGALEAYTRQRQPRAERLARQSRRIGAALAARGWLAQRARAATLGRLMATATRDLFG